MKLKKWLKDLEVTLTQTAKDNAPGKWKPESYIVGKGQSKLVFLNIKMPLLRLILKDTQLFPKNETTTEAFEKVRYTWLNSRVYEAKTVSLLWMDKQSDEFLLDHQKELILWSAQVDNWAHSDGMSAMLARIFEKDYSYLKKIFEEWNTHQHSWYRRLSMVSLFYYSNSRKKYPDYKLAEKFVSRNLSYPEYYVQKGVGWTLREMHNVYPKPTFSFLQKNIKNVSSIAWVAATEKLPAPQKNSLIKKRKG